MTRNLLLTLHLTGVAGWLGANFVQLLLSPRFAKQPAAVAAAWTRQTIWLGERYYGAIGGLIGVTGVLLVLDGDWSWGSGFIWVGITVIAIGALTGVVGFGPLAKRRADALEAGDTAAADAAQARIIPLAFFDTALIVLTILAMVDKWLV
ncbi:MAG: hypothetical protein WD691_09590 [Acidimicrobiales bacterium]